MGIRSSRARKASASRHASPASATQITGMTALSSGPIIDTLFTRAAFLRRNELTLVGRTGARRPPGAATIRAGSAAAIRAMTRSRAGFIGFRNIDGAMPITTIITTVGASTSPLARR